MLYSFQLALPSYSITRLLDPTTYVHAYQINPNSHVLHIPANLVLLCYYRCSAPALYACLRCYECYPVTPWFGLSNYYIVVDDIIIIIMLTIFDEEWKV